MATHTHPLWDGPIQEIPLELGYEFPSETTLAKSTFELRAAIPADTPARPSPLTDHQFAVRPIHAVVAGAIILSSLVAGLAIRYAQGAGSTVAARQPPAAQASPAPSPPSSRPEDSSITAPPPANTPLATGNARPEAGALGNAGISEARTALSPATPPPPRDRASSATPPTTSGLSGWWSVTNRVEATTGSTIQDLNLGYRVRLTQNGRQIVGTGYKWMENGRPLPDSQRTAIVIDGITDGRTVALHFTERSADGTKAGTFTYEITEAGVLSGRFSNDAAQSHGSSQARLTSTSDSSVGSKAP